MSYPGSSVPQAQQLRFRRPAPAKPKAPVVPAAPSLLQTAVGQSNRLWSPGLSVAFRLIILFRAMAAMYTSIADCDETFNYWEPLHYLSTGKGFQTWEHSPDYALRSYAYLVLHWPIVALARYIAPLEKRAAFFFVRISFALLSSYVESVFYRAVTDHLHVRIGRYVLLALMSSAAFFHASTSFLPSTFALYCNLYATSIALSPVDGSWKRPLKATLGFAAGAILGWPFAALLAVPFVLEQLLVRGQEYVPEGAVAKWASQRARNLFVGVAAAAAAILLPVIAIDSYAYGSLQIVPLNLISYNLLSSARGRGPELYGTSPASFYLFNGILGFNVLFPLALLSLPALLITKSYDNKRVGGNTPRRPGSTSPYTALAIRLAPLYLWLAAITAQKHKEERFLYPAYGLVLLNAAVTIYLARGWFETAFVKATSSPYRAGKTKMFAAFTTTILLTTTLLSVSRIVAVYQFYHAPVEVYSHLSMYELPRLALLRFPAVTKAPRNVSPYADAEVFKRTIDRADATVDISALSELNLRLCTGREWYRYPSSFFVPSQLDVGFVDSGFKGILPKQWEAPGPGKGLFGRATSVVPSGMNDLNKEEKDRYVPLESCSYFVDLHFPQRKGDNSPVADSNRWEKVVCRPFLDAENSAQVARLGKVPFAPEAWKNKLQWGEYCLWRKAGL